MGKKVTVKQHYCPITKSTSVVYWKQHSPFKQSRWYISSATSDWHSSDVNGRPFKGEIDPASSGAFTFHSLSFLQAGVVPQGWCWCLGDNPRIREHTPLSASNCRLLTLSLKRMLVADKRRSGNEGHHCQGWVTSFLVWLT